MTATLAHMSENHPRRGLTDKSRVPTPAEIRTARERAGLSQSEAAARVLGSVKAWQNWESENPAENRRMHPGLFKLFLILTNQPVPDWLK